MVMTPLNRLSFLWSTFQKHFVLTPSWLWLFHAKREFGWNRHGCQCQLCLLHKLDRAILSITWQRAKLRVWCWVPQTESKTCTKTRDCLLPEHFLFLTSPQRVLAGYPPSHSMKDSFIDQRQRTSCVHGLWFKWRGEYMYACLAMKHAEWRVCGIACSFAAFWPWRPYIWQREFGTTPGKVSSFCRQRYWFRFLLRAWKSLIYLLTKSSCPCLATRIRCRSDLDAGRAGTEICNSKTENVHLDLDLWRSMGQRRDTNNPGFLLEACL